MTIRAGGKPKRAKRMITAIKSTGPRASVQSQTRAGRKGRKVGTGRKRG